jgi:hypothetical protein
MNRAGKIVLTIVVVLVVICVGYFVLMALLGPSIANIFLRVTSGLTGK